MKTTGSLVSQGQQHERRVRRVLVHLQVHGLPASVEERERGGRPVVLCDESGHQVVSVSPTALRCGVREGDSRWEAQRRCANVAIVQPSPEKYEHFWEQVREICGDYGPEVWGASGYQASLDLTGTERLFGLAKRVAHEIRNRLHVEMGLVASVGIGPNPTVARLACELTRPGEVAEVLAEEAAEFLGRLPVSALPGVDGERRRRLEELGIARVVDLVRLPREAVERALGEWGRRLWEIAQSDGPGDTRTSRGAPGRQIEEESVFAQRDLRPPTEDRDRIAVGLRAAAEEAARKLREQGQAGYQVRIEVVFRDLRTVGTRRTLGQPTHSGEVIFRAARGLLDRMKLNGRGVRRVRVRVSRLVMGPQGGQLALPLLEREARRERLAEMVDRIHDRFGEGAVTRASTHHGDGVLVR